jgi:dimeric dUTPase (all-alpha-NTP-PPase superfamily)
MSKGVIDMTKVLDEYKGVILLFLSIALVLTMMHARVKELNANAEYNASQEISYENK